MGFKSNKVEIQGVHTDKVGTPLTHNIELTEKEIEFILVTIKNGLFKGEYVEILYNLTLKLQEKYVKVKKL
jgi:hypothetical protein|tara:strand:+ start:1453 stop:1665 length:213 start_codon:yes stop_codon:yes gene_type:complete